MKEIILESSIVQDDYTAIVEKMFDVPILDKSVVVIKNNIKLPEKWNIGLIYGASGAGKSTLLKEFGEIKSHKWDNKKSMISNFTNVTPEQASEVLCSVGFGTVPSWIRPYSALSNGEKFRADLARSLTSKDDLILIDEFTSVVDRNVAKSASNSVQKYIRKYNKKIVLASCHSDIVEWLNPCWTYNPVEGIVKTISSERLLWRPKIELEIFRVHRKAWELFKNYHYLSADLNKTAKCFVATWNDIPVAFCGILNFCHPVIKAAYRESRTVVLGDYQGLSIGVKLSDFIGSIVTANTNKNGIPYKFYTKTRHPAMVAYKLKHTDLYRQTSHSGEARNPAEKSMKSRGWDTTEKKCWCFEYIGPKASETDAKLFL